MTLLLKTLSIVTIFSFTLILTDYNSNLLDHKNAQLKLYLDAIQYNLQEKIGILPYILEKKSGNYLEIGTGGDPVAELIQNIPQDFTVKIIASDIDQNVLDSLLNRHPELQSYTTAQFGIQLQLQQLNAIDMSAFPKNFLDGINASSVVHEIVSYAGGYDGYKKFFQEAYRTLKNDGILIYRDPEFVYNEQEIVTAVLKNKVIKLFAHIFLYKFLDSSGSLLAQENRKIIMYNKQQIQFTVYKKNEPFANTYSYEEYLKIPSYDIDFSRKYTISLPYGLYRELSRHYLTYLHACNPLIYLKLIPDITNGSYFVNYWAHSTAKVFKNFLNQHAQHVADEQVTIQQKDLIEAEIEKNCRVLEFGIPLGFTSKEKKRLLRKLLKDHHFNPSAHIIAIDNKTTLLDYRVFGILYEQIKQLFDAQNGTANTDDEKHAVWLKREGEENYCYLSADKLISQVLLTSLEKAEEETDTIEDIMVLCPIDKEHNKFLNRWCYSELLKESLDVYDFMDYPIEVFDGKRIIHFKKMPLQEALIICKTIIETEPLKYLQLKEVVDRLNKRYKGT